jgi:four helix bundle protein
MALIKRFEDIQAWQEGRKLVQQVYRITNSDKFARDFSLKDQIRRAAVSTMANIAEGFDCESKAEFARFLGIARRSAVEVQSLLYTALGIGHIDAEVFQSIYDQAEKTKALTGAFMHSLRQRTGR